MVSLIWADSGAEGLWRVYGAGLCLKEYEGHVPRSNVSDRGENPLLDIRIQCMDINRASALALKSFYVHRLLQSDI